MSELTNIFSSIADAIRSKTATSATISPVNMSNAISGMTTYLPVNANTIASAELPSPLTTLSYDGNLHAFFKDGKNLNLNNLTIDWNRVVDASNLFENAAYLPEAMNIFNTFENYSFNEISFNYMFANSPNFNQSVTIPNNIKDIVGLFSGCTDFNSTLTVENISNITSFAQLYENCHSCNEFLTNDITNKNIYKAFVGINSPVDFILQNRYPTDNGDYAFMDAIVNSVHLNITSDVGFGDAKISDYMFHNCSGNIFVNNCAPFSFQFNIGNSSFYKSTVSFDENTNTLYKVGESAFEDSIVQFQTQEQLRILNSLPYSFRNCTLNVDNALIEINGQSGYLGNINAAYIATNIHGFNNLIIVISNMRARISNSAYTFQNLRENVNLHWYDGSEWWGNLSHAFDDAHIYTYGNVINITNAFDISYAFNNATLMNCRGVELPNDESNTIDNAAYAFANTNIPVNADPNAYYVFNNASHIFDGYDFSISNIKFISRYRIKDDASYAYANSRGLSFNASTFSTFDDCKNMAYIFYNSNVGLNFSPYGILMTNATNMSHAFDGANILFDGNAQIGSNLKDASSFAENSPHFIRLNPWGTPTDVNYSNCYRNSGGTMNNVLFPGTISNFSGALQDSSFGFNGNLYLNFSSNINLDDFNIIRDCFKGMNSTALGPYRIHIPSFIPVNGTFAAHLKNDWSGLNKSYVEASNVFVNDL